MRRKSGPMAPGARRMTIGLRRDVEPDDAKKVTAFLVKTQYPLRDDLTKAPPQEELERILEFLLRQIDENFSWPASEKEKSSITQLKVILTQLRYPGKLGRSELMNWKTHWPHILEALSWLVDLIQTLDHQDASAEDRFTQDFYHFVTKAYDLYMSSRDESKERLQTEFEEQLWQRNQEDSQLNEEIRQRNAQLQREIDALADTGLREQEEKKANNEADIIALEQYVRDLEDVERKKEQRLAKQQKALAALSDKLAQHETTRHKLQSRIHEQESKSIDVDKLKHETRCNDEELAALRENRRVKESAKFDVETAESRALQAAEEAVQSFNTLASETQQTGAVDRELPMLELNFHANPPDSLLKTDLRGMVRPLLKKVTEDLENRGKQLREKIMRLNLQVDDMKPLLEETTVACAKTNQHIEHVRNLISKEKEASLQETAQMESRIAAIELEVQQLRDKIANCLLQSDENLQSVEESYRRCKLDIEAEEAEWKSQLSRMVETLVSHKERITGALLKLGAHLDENHGSYLTS